MDRSKKASGRSVRDALEELSPMLIAEARAGETCWMVETRGLFAMAFIALSSAGSIAENAAEDPVPVVRNYRAPLQSQHYYPTTGVKPKVGRTEDLLAPATALQPAEPYRRKF
jgi:hypothetical protein